MVVWDESVHVSLVCLRLTADRSNGATGVSRRKLFFHPPISMPTLGSAFTDEIKSTVLFYYVYITVEGCGTEIETGRL